MEINNNFNGFNISNDFSGRKKLFSIKENEGNNLYKNKHGGKVNLNVYIKKHSGKKKFIDLKINNRIIQLILNNNLQNKIDHFKRKEKEKENKNSINIIKENKKYLIKLTYKNRKGVENIKPNELKAIAIITMWCRNLIVKYFNNKIIKIQSIWRRYSVQKKMFVEYKLKKELLLKIINKYNKKIIQNYYYKWVYNIDNISLNDIPYLYKYVNEENSFMYEDDKDFLLRISIIKKDKYILFECLNTNVINKEKVIYANFININDLIDNIKSNKKQDIKKF